MEIVRRDFEVAPEELLAAVEASAGDWGAAWTPAVSDGAGTAGGRLVLPALAGLRRGLLTADLVVSGRGAGASAVEARVVEEFWKLNLAAVMVLLMSAAGAAVTFLWPFYPRLLPALPVGALIAISGWFLVVNRLRTSGVEEFLEGVEAAGVVEDAGEPASS